MSLCYNALKLGLFMFFSVTIFSPCSRAMEPGRWEMELSGEGWKLWLDHEAPWLEDDVYMPPVDVRSLPVNLPTCGWERLDFLADKTVSVPGTVEEHFWGFNGNPVGRAGDYRGVSWWSRTFTIDPSLRGKRIILSFDSVNLRAEIFVNRKLVGYDVIGNTPFEVEVTSAVRFDSENRIDVRITDPVGYFDWRDHDLYRWGTKNKVPAVHGFGGITGKIYIRATDDIYINDIYIQNKPSISSVNAFLSIKNLSGVSCNGTLTCTVHEWKNSSAIIWKETVPAFIPIEDSLLSLSIDVPKAKIWNIRDPQLYVASFEWKSKDGTIADSSKKRFGFRWFDVGEKNGDKRYYLNGRRVFIFSAMTRGFWPKNGIFPTSEMAKRDVEIALRLGYNMMLFHKSIGQHYVTEMCDEVGLLTYEEPSGYRCVPEPDETSKIWRREKLRRMILRDRSYPSLVIYNIKNGSGKPPDEDDIHNIDMVHTLDPSRIVTYNSDRNRTIPYTVRLEKDPFKLHMLPFDNTHYFHGWWDQHHWISHGVYLDDYYENPRFFLRGTSVVGDSLYRLQEDELIFWGEEGDIGAMMRLEKIKNELSRTGATGWREAEHLNYYYAYERFLDETSFRSSFPTVDDLTLSLGRNMHYFHGRILENVRLSNVADGYNLNGWASATTHTDIVDVYRNPTADPSILSYYAQPLYIAVKIRDKVCPVGFTPVADIFIINEKNLIGKHTLLLELTDPHGKTVFSEKYYVTVLGGEEFGQLLVGGVSFPPLYIPGYYTLNARLLKKNEIITTGYDDIFVVDYMHGIGIDGTVAVIDTSGVVQTFLAKSRRVKTVPFNETSLDPKYIIVGEHNFTELIRSKVEFASGIDPLLERVANGSILVVLDNADRWAQQLNNVAVQYINTYHFGKGGRLFVGKSSYLDGLPLSQGMNWEYQYFYYGDVWGIGITNLGNELIVGLASQGNKEIVSALSRIPYGKGQIFLVPLNILPGLASKEPQSASSKKLFLNILESSNSRTTDG